MAKTTVHEGATNAAEHVEQPEVEQEAPADEPAPQNGRPTRSRKRR